MCFEAYTIRRDPKAQGKLITVFRGRIFDVVVDIRRGSPTHGRWVSVDLSEECYTMVYIPRGFAHGFCVLSAEAGVIYKTTEGVLA
jgi:dTDP-4-dehydrorhamnose 3,5-epimerase